ncbi:hypothetical protein HDU89_001120 [Geranomyces variabilis]|nr:hypothetical protein HDU89_001120 [Geranomyces variabilis]
MADAAARREARRQKILASGQDRLNKLTSTFTGRPVEPTATAPTPASPTVSNEAIEGSPGVSSDLPSTPPSLSDSQLRQRNIPSSSSSRIPPQSSSVTSTPPEVQSSHDKPSIAAHFPVAPSPSAVPSFPTGDLFGDPDDMLMAELQARMMGNNAALAPPGGAFPSFPAGFSPQQFGDASAQPPPQLRAPVQPPPRWTFLSLFRAAVMLFLALFTLRNLAGAVDDVVDVAGDDEIAPPEWRLQARRVAALATTQLSEGGGDIRLGLGGEDGTWVSVWMCFLAVELVLQTIGFFGRPSRPAIAPNPFDPLGGTAGDLLNGGGDLMSTVVQMASMSSPKLDLVVRSVRDYSAIFRSFMNDLLTYIFVLGAGIALALCFQ